MTKRLAFALIGAAAITLAGCGRAEEDQVTNADLNATEINAEEASEISNEADTLQNQAEQLQNEVEDAGGNEADPTVNQAEADVAVNGM